jgi:hypothetical protein
MLKMQEDGIGLLLPVHMQALRTAHPYSAITGC